MSDYGSSLSVRRADKADLAAEDHKRIQEAVEAEISSGEYSSVGEEFKSEGQDFGDERMFILTEYWDGEGDNEENFEFAKEEDEPLATQLRERVQSVLGNDYVVEWKFEGW